MTISVSFHIQLNETMIRAHQSLADWISWYNRAHDAFTDRTGLTWDDIYAAIATDYFSGGDLTQFVINSGVDVESDGPDIGTDGHPEMAGDGLSDDGVTHHGHGVFRVAGDN